VHQARRASERIPPRRATAARPPLAAAWPPGLSPALPAMLLATLLAACSACPPTWAARPADRPGLLVAAGRAGAVFVEAEARSVALVRAARVLAERLGLDVETRLSVHESDGRLFVEAVGAGGPTSALDGLVLLDVETCGDETHVLVGLPRP